MAQLSRPANDRGSYRDSVARLALIRKSLERAELSGAGPAPDLDDQVVGAASASLNALAAVRGDSEASRELVERIRRELAEISNLVLKA